MGTESYATTGEYWAQKAHTRGAVDSRGKQLRRDGFGLAEERYGVFFSHTLCRRVLTVVAAEYKPILEEVEKILAEAGLDDKEMREMSQDVSGVSSGGQSRNRR